MTTPSCPPNVMVKRRVVECVANQEPVGARAGIMKWPPYPQYKPSAVEWLGDVPEHWEALPLKRRHRVVNGGTPSSSEDRYWEGRINWITPEDLGRNGSKRIGSSQRTLSDEGLSNCGAQLVPADSIVLSTRAPIGHVAITERESCTNQGCRALVSVDRRVSSELYLLLAYRLPASPSGRREGHNVHGVVGRTPRFARSSLFPPLNEHAGPSRRFWTGRRGGWTGWWRRSGS